MPETVHVDDAFDFFIRELAEVPEFERDHLIRARTGKGRARAKASGESLGLRRFKTTVHQRKEALARRERGELFTEIARCYNVSAATISRLGG